MWAHYGNNHRGVCLVFERAHLDYRIRQSSEYSSSVYSQAVRYQPQIPRRRLLLNDADIRPECRQTAADKWIESSRPLLFMKSNDWNHEREFRWLVNVPPGSGKYQFVDYDTSLVGVVFGPRTDEAWKDMVLSVLPEHVRCLHRLRWMQGTPVLDEI